MVAPAICRFDLQIVNVLDRLGVAQDVIVATPNVAAEEVAEFARTFANIQDDLRGPQDMPCIPERDGHSIDQWHRTIIIEADKLAHCLLCIDRSVKWLDGWQTFFCALLRDEFRIVALNSRRILEHDGSEVAC